MDVLDMGQFPRADMKLRPGITPVMNAKERYEYPDEKLLYYSNIKVMGLDQS